MAELEVQTALRSGVTLDGLRSRYGIRAVPGKTAPDLVSLKYTQIESDFSLRIVKQCRGLVLDAARDWELVARGFDKFHNYGEGLAAAIDWSTARVQEKLDGSLCIVYHHDGAWRVATSGSPDASGPVYDTTLTFADLFWQTFRSTGLTLSHLADRDCFYLFELCCAENRIVVQHEWPSVTLIGVRRRDGDEVPVAQFAEQFPTVSEFGIGSIEDIVASFERINPLQQEGYVVVDSAFRRVKVKHPTYVALHHLRGSMSNRALLEVARSGEMPELMASFPEIAARVRTIQESLDRFAGEVEADYARIAGLESQKDFAIAAQPSRCPSALFALRSGKASSVRTFCAGMHIDNLAKLLNVSVDTTALVDVEA